MILPASSHQPTIGDPADYLDKIKGSYMPPAISQAFCIQQITWISQEDADGLVVLRPLEICETQILYTSCPWLLLVTYGILSIISGLLN